MRNRHGMLLILIISTVVISLLLGCGGDGPGPEETIHNALQAMEEGDAEKFAGYFTEDLREEVEFGMAFAFALIEDVEISKVITRIVSQTSNEATVEFEYDMKARVFDEIQEDHVEEVIDLVKVDGKWLMSEFEAFD